MFGRLVDMATRTLIIDLSKGTGGEPMYGMVTVQRTRATSEGTFEVLPWETKLKLFNGIATITEAVTDGPGPFYDSAYLIRVQNGYCAPRWGFMVALPDGTTPISTGDMPKVNPITGEGIYMDAQEWNALYGTLPDRVTSLENSQTVQDERLDSLEVLGGISPGDVSDATVKSLIINPESETSTALSAAIGESVTPVVESVAALTVEVGEVSLNRAPVLDMPIKARTFHSALYQTGRGRAIRIAVIGSSTSEGAGVNHLNDRWVDHLGMRLQRGLLTGNPASHYQTRFYPALWQTQTFTNPALTGSTRAYPSDPTFADWYGPAGRDVRLELGSTPGTITFTVYGRRVRLWHSKSGSLGIPHYSIDGGADVALPTQNNATITAGHRTAWIDLGSLGQHTFTVKANLSNSVMVSGLEVSTVATDAEESNQVHIYEMSRSGTDFLTTAGVHSWMNPSWKERQYEWLKTANPDLIIMGAGSNAYAFGLATPAQIETNVRTFISEAQAVMGTYPSWLLVGQQERQPPASPLAPWADYLSALERIAADTSGVSFIDWTDHIPAYDDDATFYADIAHVNRLGHALAGYHTAAKLTGG